MIKRYILENKNKWIWIALGLIAIIVRVLLSQSPKLIERYYSRGFFIGIRYFLDTTLGWFPLPFVQVLLIGILRTS